MLVLHAHWIAPRRPHETGGVLFWAEDSSAKQPATQHGRLPQKPRPKPHPYQANIDTLRALLRKPNAQRESVLLNLPSTRSGPLPSPRFTPEWALDHETQPFIAPWWVHGLWCLPRDALPLLLDLPVLERKSRNLVIAEDAKYWRIAVTLVLEALAAQKAVPVINPVKGGYQARWLPIFDSPRDAQRLGFMEKNMPPVCRASIFNERRPEPPPSPGFLLTSFLNGLTDSLARQWGWNEIRGKNNWGDQTAARWLAALFREEATIKGTPAQLQSLNSGYRAWIRNLHLAGDATFRICFRLQPPAEQAIDASLSRGKPPADWELHYLLQARDDPSLLVPADQVWKSTNEVLSQLGHRFELPQEKLLAGLGYAGRLFNPISESLKEKSPTLLKIDTVQAYFFLREAAPMLEEAGFGLLTPPWWNQPGARLGMRLRLKPTQPMSGNGKLSFQNLIEYRWELSLGETALTEQEFRALAALKTPLVQIRGQWVQLDPEQVEAAIQFWEKQKLSGRISLLEALQMGMNASEVSTALPVEEVVSEDWLSDWLDRFNQPGKLSEILQPAGLKGELRPYQRFGYSWLSFFHQWGLGACLADDMGLGKTIQTLALLVKEKETLGRLPAPALLVAPTSVVTNWEHEVRRFAPGLCIYTHQGPGRLRGDDFYQALKGIDMVLTSYSLVRQDAELLQSVHWHMVIVDEAQNIKNPAARQTQMVRQLPAGFRLALTGTPVENRLSELWSIMNFLNPGYLGTRDSFQSNFALPIERYNNQEALQRLKKMVGPFILRRVKTDPTVIQDLPEKVETKVYCYLTEEQATLYEAVVKDAMQKVEDSDGISRRGNVLSMLMQLKQVCNHPVQFLHQVGQDGSTATADWVSRSGKLERLTEMLEEILAEGDRALIFSQFAEMGELLASALPQALGCQVQFLHGGTPAKQRDVMIQRFQEEKNGPPIFILSLKAGGLGLNLTRANHVFHFDRWWNPAVENQATDRAFRIGQKRNVQVHKFITTGTLEEMIDDMIESKKGLADAIIGSGEAWLTELSTADLRELVQLRKV
ncbi:MAG TPA: DEAD/DEAH box helicase [Anaerolineaceae bacterium]